MYYFKFESPLGNMVACMDDNILKGLWFEDQRYFPDIPDNAVWTEPDPLLVEAVQAYCTGHSEGFRVICQPEGTDFQKTVWAVLETIPYGTTLTYKAVSMAVAEKLGKKSMSAQAVGSAIGKNPISIIIPCHRVIGTDGSLTGYAGGLDRKLTLLRLEGAML